MTQGDTKMELHISAQCHNISSPIQAEAQALKLAAMLAKQMHLQGATFLTDNLTLAKAAAARHPMK